MHLELELHPYQLPPIEIYPSVIASDTDNNDGTTPSETAAFTTARRYYLIGAARERFGRFICPTDPLNCLNFKLDGVPRTRCSFAMRLESSSEASDAALFYSL